MVTPIQAHTEGMMARWLHVLQQFQFSIIHRPGRDHGNADGLSRAPSSPCRQCTHPDCPPVVLLPNIVDQPFDSESTGSSEDADLIPIHSGEDWVAHVDDDFSQTAAISVSYIKPTAGGPCFHYATFMDFVWRFSPMG